MLSDKNLIEINLIIFNKNVLKSILSIIAIYKSTKIIEFNILFKKRVHNYLENFFCRIINRSKSRKNRGFIQLKNIRNIDFRDIEQN